MFYSKHFLITEIIVQWSSLQMISTANITEHEDNILFQTDNKRTGFQLCTNTKICQLYIAVLSFQLPFFEPFSLSAKYLEGLLPTTI